MASLPSRAGDPDRPLLGLEHDLGDAGTRRVASRSTCTLSRSASQVTSRSALGLIRSAVTDADVTVVSVLVERRGQQRPPRASAGSRPGRCCRARTPRTASCMACCLPRVTAAASVIRRWASAPSGSPAGSIGALLAHQMATGESGSSSGSTTDSAMLDDLAAQPDHGGLAGPAVRRCRPGRARGRRRGRRPGSPRAPAPGAPWRRPSGRPPSRRRRASSSTTTIRVSTMPIAGLPALIRSRTKAAAISEELVSVSSIIQGRLQTRPSRAQHRVGRLGAPGAGRRTARGDGPCLAQ